MENDTEDAVLNACPSPEALEPEAAAGIPTQSLTASTQKESFEVVGRAAASLLAAAFCTEDPEVVRKLAEELKVTGDTSLVGGEFPECATDGREGEAADSSQSTPHIEGEEESIFSNQDQEPACTGSFHLEQVPLGSALFSGSLTVNQEGALSILGPATVYFENGTKYMGLLCNRMGLCGDASIQWPSGATYEGQVTRGLRHGIGTYTSADGNFTYEGEWCQGVRSGWGVLSSADGSKYSGEWAAGRRHGFGEQVFADGSRYEGQWVDGLQEGQGLMIWKEPAVQYVGEWRRGTVSGWGRQTWIETPDFDGGGAWTVGRNLQQNQYEGQFQNGRREGVGAFSYSNGARYEGSWVADQKHGIGTFKSETGALYEGLFVYDRMAEAPPSTLDDPVRALVDLSTAQQAEVYRHLEAYDGQNLWTQVPACERLAARTIRSVYQTMLRNMCVLRRVYGAYRRMAPMPHTDPYVLSCAQFWCLAFDAGLLGPSASLHDTAKILLSSWSDEKFQRARRLSGGTPATLTVIEAERRRSTCSIDFRLTELTGRSTDAAPTAAPTEPLFASTGEAPAPAKVPATAADEEARQEAQQQPDSSKPLPGSATTPSTVMSILESHEQGIIRPEKAGPRAYEVIGEDSLRIHRRPVLFTAFLRGLVILLQIRLRNLQRGDKNNSDAGGSGATFAAGAFERLDLEDPHCLSLAWTALCRKLRIFSDTLERQIRNDLKGVSHKDENTQNEHGNQALRKKTSQAEASESRPGGLSRVPSEQPQPKQSVPPQPPARRQDTVSQQLRRSPSGPGMPKPSINRQQSGTTCISTRKAPDAYRYGPATGPTANDSRAKGPSRWPSGSHGEGSVPSSEEVAASAGRHAEVFRQAALAEKCCTLDETLHRALFSTSPQRFGSSVSEHENSAGIPGTVVCIVRALFRQLDIAGLVLPSDHQQAAKGTGESSPITSVVCGPVPRSRRSSSGGSILLHRLSTSRGRLSKSRPSKAPEWPTNAGEAASMLRSTPLSAFALPALGLVAVMLEVLPKSAELHRHQQQSKKLSIQQEKEQDQSKVKADGNLVESSTDALDDGTAAKRDEIQRQQHQQMLWLDQQQQALREAMRKGQLSWTEIASWKLTVIEVQRLLLRIVQLKMPPSIAALLTLERQVEEFMRLFSAAVCSPIGDTQQLLIPTLRQAYSQDQHHIFHQHSLAGDDSPAARSDATFSAAPTADAGTSRCFWQGFCGSSLKGRQIYDPPLKISESVASEVPDSEDGTESETSDSLN